MKRRDFFNLSVSAVPGLALLSCSKKANPIEPVLEESVFVPLPQTQATIEGQLPNDGGDHVGRLITITGPVMFAFHCGLFWNDYACTVSDQDGGAHSHFSQSQPPSSRWIVQMRSKAVRVSASSTPVVLASLKASAAAAATTSASQRGPFSVQR